MRLGVVTSSFPRTEGDHAGVFVLELCKALVDRGHRVEVIAPDPGRGQPPSWPGIRVRWVRYGAPRSWQAICYDAGIPENVRRRPWLAAQGPLVGSALALEVSRRSERWEGVISHWLVPSGLATAIACRGTPHVAVAHSADVWLLRTLPVVGSAVVQRIASGSTTIAAINPELVASLEELSGRSTMGRTVLLPIGPDSMPAPQPEAMVKLRERLEASGISDDHFAVAAIARLVPIKGVDLLLRALADHAAPGSAAVIAGDGPERPRLEALARDLEVPTAFLGPVDAEARAAVLARADVLIVPSRVMPNGRSEGTPLAAIEAMAAGVPVVASDVGGLRWALDGAGVLFEPGSAAGLARDLARLRADGALRDALSTAGRRRAGDFGWARSAATLEALLEAS